MPLDSEPPDLSVSPLAEAVAADTVVTHAMGPHEPHQPVHTHCENCGTPLLGPYCHRCGQHDFEFHRSFRHVFLDALENFFHFDAKIFRNIVTLLFNPGRLSADFNAGKRAAQMPPFRIYLFVSVLFFFLTFVGRTTSGLLQLDGADGPAAAAARAGVATTANEAMTELRKDLDDAQGDSPAQEKIRASAAKLGAAAEKIDAAVKTAATSPLPAASPSATTAPVKTSAAQGKAPQSRTDRWLEQQFGRLKEPQLQREFLDNFLHNIPRLLLFCLPLFALYTRILFRKSGLVYLQHLVVALHFHTFIFLWLMCQDGWVFLTGLPHFGLEKGVAFATTLWLGLYPVLMLRRLFANSWKLTIFKTGLLAFAYFVTLGMALGAAAIILILFT